MSQLKSKENVVKLPKTLIPFQLATWRENYFYKNRRIPTQNVLNTVKESARIVNIRRQYNTEEVPSQFKNNMNYTYCIQY